MISINEKKVVNKPWGKEKWLELNDKYCFKQIEINKGHQTSLQYHKNKKETICMISGKATLIHGNIVSSDGKITGNKSTPLSSGDHFTVYPGDLHRMVANTDIVFLETSTPEVCVERIKDDYDRK